MNLNLGIQGIFYYSAEHKVLLDNGIATGRAEWVMEFSECTFYTDSNVYIDYNAQH